jgi:hypothetical protein
VSGEDDRLEVGSTFLMIWTTWTQSPALSLNCSVTSGELLNLSESPCPLLYTLTAASPQCTGLGRGITEIWSQGGRHLACLQKGERWMILLMTICPHSP